MATRVSVPPGVGPRAQHSAARLIPSYPGPGSRSSAPARHLAAANLDVVLTNQKPTTTASVAAVNAEGANSRQAGGPGWCGSEADRTDRPQEPPSRHQFGIAGVVPPSGRPSLFSSSSRLSTGGGPARSISSSCRGLRSRSDPARDCQHEHDQSDKSSDEPTNSRRLLGACLTQVGTDLFEEITSPGLKASLNARPRVWRRPPLPDHGPSWARIASA